MRLGAVMRVFVIAVITLALLEISINIWINHFADKQTFQQFATFDDVLERYLLRFKEHPYLNYMNAPKYKKNGTRHDKRGYRGPRFSKHKAPGAFRIVAIGGSTTYTEFVDDDRDTYPAQLQKRLRKLGYAKIEVINAGAPGYTSWESLINLEFRVLDLEPDMVINYDALNDVHARLVDPDHYRGDNTGYRRQWKIPRPPCYEQVATVRVLLRLLGRSKTATDLHDLTTRTDTYRYKNRAPTPKAEILKRNLPTYFERNLKSMIAVAKINNVQIMFATFAYHPKKNDYLNADCYRKGIAEHNQIIRNLAAEYNVPVFDFAAKMPTLTCPKCWHDGRHVSKKGAALQGKLFADFIDQQDLIPRESPSEEQETDDL